MERLSAAPLACETDRVVAVAIVVRLDTNEEIGSFADLHGPLPAGQGFFLDAWRDSAGDLHATPPAPDIQAVHVLLNMPVLHPESADCVILVTPTYLAFVIQHPAFRPLPPRLHRRLWRWSLKR